jgi:DUF4097 and DUF4098 domain-containing protein YvlB
MRTFSGVRVGLAVLLSVALVPMVVSAQSRNSGRSWFDDDDRGPKETERVDKTVSFPSNGTLRLKNFSGDIHIVGTSGRDVVVKASRRAPRAQLDHIKLDIQTSGSGVTIEANKRDADWEDSHHNNNVVETTLEVEVPASARLDIDAFSSDVTIEGITGDQAVKTFNGEIRVRDLKGAMDAETFSGDINVFVYANQKGSLSFNTFSGDCDSALPISSTSLRKRSLEGALPAGGGPRLHFKTFSGDLQIRAR